MNNFIYVVRSELIKDKYFKNKEDAEKFIESKYMNSISPSWRFHDINKSSYGNWELLRKPLC